jgi:hypothetical protein
MPKQETERPPPGGLFFCKLQRRTEPARYRLTGSELASRRAGVRPEIAAALLIGACTEYASLRQMTGKTPGNLKKTAYANAVIESLAPILFPGK